MKFSFFLFTVLIIGATTAISQNETNKYDAQGKRHGIWKKNFKNSEQLRYEGEFVHGKEVGVFKFYCSDCEDEPIIVKTFNNTDNIALVNYYTKKGKLVSEGKMIDKNRVGKWIYYHKKNNNVMTEENYVSGALDGLKTTYYLNNKITEELEYKSGIKEGINNHYSPKGILLKKLLYKNDNLQGAAIYYDANGNVVLEGSYKNGRKNGIWKSYKNKKLIKEETFPKSY